MLIWECANDEVENEWQNVIIACFIPFLLTIYFLLFGSLRAPFRSEKSKLIGKHCACIFPKFLIKPHFFVRAHGANNTYEVVSFNRNRAGIGQSAYDGKKIMRCQWEVVNIRVNLPRVRSLS